MTDMRTHDQDDGQHMHVRDGATRSRLAAGRSRWRDRPDAGFAGVLAAAPIGRRAVGASPGDTQPRHRYDGRRAIMPPSGDRP